MRVSMPWGGEGEILLNLPQTWRTDVFSPRSVSAVADVAEEVLWAVTRPRSAVPLDARSLERRKVVIVADDHTRPTPAQLVLPPVLDLLAGTGVTKPLLIPALGTHREMTDAELEQKYGPDVLSRVRVRFPRPRVPEANVEVGTVEGGIPIRVMREVAEADLVISLGTVQPHVLAGFGGGYKNLAIGCGEIGTITALHELVTRDEFRQMIGRSDAPMRTAIEAAGRLLRGEVFLVNCVLNAAKEIVAVFAGDPADAFTAARRRVAEMYAVDIGAPADVVLTNSSPMDLNLRQGMKCLTASMFAAREGGVLGAFMYNRNGLESYDPPTSGLPPVAVRGLLKLLGPRRLAALSERTLVGINDEDKVFIRVGVVMAARRRLLVYSPRISHQRRRLPFYHFCDPPQELIDRAARLVPPRARCVVLPHGGVTYPAVSDQPSAVGRISNPSGPSGPGIESVARTDWKSVLQVKADC